MSSSERAAFFIPLSFMFILTVDYHSLGKMCYNVCHTEFCLAQRLILEYKG